MYSNIKRFIKAHTSSNGNNTVIVNNYGSSGNNITGDNINVVNVTSNNVDAYNLNAKNADIINANVVYLMTDNGKINKLSGVELEYTTGQINDLSSHAIKTDELTVKDTATIENLINTNITSKNIVTDYLTVNKSAHFFELVIDKMRSVQGTQMNTAANCIADFVQAYNSAHQLVAPTASNVAYYRIYWKCTDDDGREVKNDWKVLDQALCESFNVNTGTTYDVSNKYYWRKVIQVDNGNKRYVNFDTKTVRTTEPASYQITFPNRFSFTTPEFSTPFTDFNIESQIINQWDDTNNIWTCTTTNYGLQITYNQDPETPAYSVALGHGTFSFSTNIKTKLNIGVYYDDGTFDYFPADTYKTSYTITTTEGKMFEAIVINTAAVDKWEKCNWIDLSNSDKDDPQPDKSAIPSEGDNICQLGYRYTELQNPTQDDINRASAIIIAAYETPDSEITPPSYAQYQNIHDYNLSSHRKTYFDANGSEVFGKFVVNAAGQEIDLDDYIIQQAGAATTDIVVKANGGELGYCLLQVDNSNEIHDLNNFPEYIDLQVVNYTSAQSINVNSAYVELFGRNLDLIAIMQGQTSDSGNGIYVQQVTFGGTDKLTIKFNFRGTSQTITNGAVITFSGQAVVDGATMNLSKTLTIGAVTSFEGLDAEFYELNVVKESAIVDGNQTLDPELIYNLKYISGTTVTYPTSPNTMTLDVVIYYNDGMTSTETVNWDSTNNYWKYYLSQPITNYYSGDVHVPVYYVIKLMDGNNVVDTKLVNINLSATSLFVVDEGLTSSIQAETTARTNQYTSISQTVSSINSRVGQTESDINDITGEITDINVTMSDIDQKADRIGLHVNTIDDGLQTTGIDIEQGTITIDSNKLTINGNVDLQGHFIGDIESYNETTQNRTKISTSSAGTSGLIMSGPDRVDPITGLPDSGTQEVDLIKMEFTTTSGARAGSIKVQSANSNNIYTNIWQESIGISNDQNYITTRPEGITYGLRGSQTYDIEQRANNQSITTSWPALLTGCLKVTKIDSITYNAKIYDSIIIVDRDFGGNFTINLPAPYNAVGKHVYIKNKTSRNGYITCVGSTSQNPLIMDHEDTDLDASRDIQRDSTELICDGDHWILFSYQY